MCYRAGAASRGAKHHSSLWRADNPAFSGHREAWSSGAGTASIQQTSKRGVKHDRQTTIVWFDGILVLSGLLVACVTRSAYDQLNQQLSAEIAQGQVHITRLQGAIKVTINSELLFPSGGWQMPPAEIAPVLAPMQAPAACQAPTMILRAPLGLRDTVRIRPAQPATRRREIMT